MSPDYSVRAYISGPMTNLPNFNYPAFHEAADILRAKGYEVLNPAEAFEGNQTLPVATYLRHDIESVLKADMLVVLHGWEKSKGASLEVAVATGIGLPVYRLEDIRENTPALSLSLQLGITALASEPMATAAVPGDPLFILQEAERLVLGDRQKAYGHPLEDMTRTGRMWGAVLDIPDVPAEKVALCMVMVKASREVNRPKPDNRIDMAGYLLCYELTVARRKDLGG